MSTIRSFAEESCWDGEYLRSTRKQVTFRVVSVGKLSGERRDFELEADFVIWYDPDNRLLVSLLREKCPAVDWERYVYHAMLDHSQIDVLDVMDDTLVATIAVRGRRGGDPSGESDRTNVTSLCDFRLRRAETVPSEGENDA